MSIHTQTHTSTSHCSLLSSLHPEQVKQPYSVPRTTDLNEVLPAHAQQVLGREVGKQIEVLAKSVIVQPLSSLQVGRARTNQRLHRSSRCTDVIALLMAVKANCTHSIDYLYCFIGCGHACINTLHTHFCSDCHTTVDSVDDDSTRACKHS